MVADGRTVILCEPEGHDGGWWEPIEICGCLWIRVKHHSHNSKEVLARAGIPG